MTKPLPFQVSISITDFSPLFFDLEYLFKRLKTTGIDGVELVLGVKSRWNAKRLIELSQKYAVPVISLHQPPWSGLGIWFDEGFLELAKTFGVTKITCHPLSGISFDHPYMQRYLQRLVDLQEKKGVEILLENLPQKWFGLTADTHEIEVLLATVKEFGLKITLDIDHLRLASPHKAVWFSEVLPYIGNIHLSSFTPRYKHMPLYLGDLQTKAFIQALYKVKYSGLLTLELQYPGLVTFFNYDFDMVKKSVAEVRSVTPASLG